MGYGFIGNCLQKAKKGREISRPFRQIVTTNQLRQNQSKYLNDPELIPGMILSAQRFHMATHFTLPAKLSIHNSNSPSAVPATFKQHKYHAASPQGLYRVAGYPMLFHILILLEDVLYAIRGDASIGFVANHDHGGQAAGTYTTQARDAEFAI